VVRHRCPRSHRAAAPGRGRRSLSGSPGQRFPLRHGSGRPRARGGGSRPSRRDTKSNPRRQCRGAAHANPDEQFTGYPAQYLTRVSHRGEEMKIARWAGPDGPGEGFVINDRVVTFPDDLTVADVLARGLTTTRALYEQVEESTGIPLTEVIL